MWGPRGRSSRIIIVALVASSFVVGAVIPAGASHVPVVARPGVVSLFGDSLLAQSKEEVDAALRGDGWLPLIDARGGTGIVGGHAIDWCDSVGQAVRDHTPDVVVMELGTNGCGPGPSSVDLCIDCVMRSLTHIQTVVWLNVRENGFYPPNAHEINLALARADKRWPNLEIADMNAWFSGVPGLVASDGIHFTPDGERWFAELIRRTLAPFLVDPFAATGLAVRPGGHGFWTAGSDGGVFSFGDAPFFGSLGGRLLNRPVVAIAATPSGGGYWLVASDGGVFSFGDAPFFGSTGGIVLQQPIVGIAPTPTGRGYWLVASDGGVFTFGDAPFHGSTGHLRLKAPVVGMASTRGRVGYWLAAADGGVFAFGDASYLGNSIGLPPGRWMIDMARSANGYRILGTDGHVDVFLPVVSLAI